MLIIAEVGANGRVFVPYNDLLDLQTGGQGIVTRHAGTIGGGSGSRGLAKGMANRAAELATLHATGWSDGQLTRLISTEALCLGRGGSLLGAGLGLAGAASYADKLPTTLILIAVLATLTGVLVTILTSILPSLLVTRLPTVPLLAGE